MEYKRIYTKKRLIGVGKAVVSVATVLSSLSIVIGVIIYIWGKISSSDMSENDLIMRQIRSEIGDSKIESMNVADIHGFGVESIIITATDDEYSKAKGKLMVLDLVDNKMLKSVNDPFGLKSSYKTMFVNTMSSDGMGLTPNRVNIVNLNQDPSREFVVSYRVWGSTYGASFPVIYGYSYDNIRYEVIGTLPIPYYQDVRYYDTDGNVIGHRAIYYKTPIDGYYGDEISVSTYVSTVSDGANQYELPCYSRSCYYYWLKSRNYDENCLAVVYRSNNMKLYNINIYIPAYKDEQLEWGLIDSVNNIEVSSVYDALEIQRIIDEKMIDKWEIID